MSTPTIINLALHSTLLSLLGWLLVRWCLRDARQRAWAAVSALAAVVLAPVAIAWWPEPTGLVIPEAPAAPLVTWKPDWTMNLAPTAEPVVHEVEIKAIPWTWRDALPALKWLWLAGIVGFAAAQLLRTWRVARCQSYPTPCVIGLIRPVIFVPEGFKCTLNDDQWRWLLAHEGEHIRARDPLVAWMLGWGRVLLWWNPFVHSLINQWSQAREEVCDAVATAHGDTDRYADFLIDIAAHGRCDFAIAMAASRPARRLRVRLVALMEKRRVCERISLGFGITFAGILMLGAALVSCGGVKASDEPKQIPSVASAADKDAARPDYQFTRVFKLRHIRDEDAIKQLEAAGILSDKRSRLVNYAVDQLVIRGAERSLGEAVAEFLDKVDLPSRRVAVGVGVFEVDAWNYKQGEVIENGVTVAMVAASLPPVMIPPTKLVSRLDDIMLIPGRHTIVTGKDAAGQIAHSISVSTAHGENGLLRVDFELRRANVARPETVSVHLRSGRNVALLFPDGTPKLTAFVHVQARSPDGTSATQFIDRETPDRPSHKTAEWLPPELFEVKAKELAEWRADLRAKQDSTQIELSARIADIPQSSDDPEVDFAKLALSPTEGAPAPKTTENRLPRLTMAYTVKGALTDPQFQAVWRNLNQYKGAKLRTLPSAVAGNNSATQLSTKSNGDPRNLTITPLLISDYEVSLHTQLDADLAPIDMSVSLWDGQTLILGGTLKQDAKGRLTRLIFITAKIIKPDVNKGPKP